MSALEFIRLEHKSAVYRISSELSDAGIEEIRRQRLILEKYISICPGFAKSIEPVEFQSAAPPIVRSMIEAARRCGVGPMAAVAGAIAEAAAGAMSAAGATTVVVDNGGDLFLHADRELTIALYSGFRTAAKGLALRIVPAEMPCSICSSSATMGHSLSYGSADLATVVASDGALADAAATRLCNEVTCVQELRRALDTIIAIDGIRGAIVTIGAKIGIIGEIPEVIRHRDADIKEKITAHKNSGL